jgi:hypothetical protein
MISMIAGKMLHQGVSVKVFLEKIFPWIGRLSKYYLLQCAWTPSNLSKTLIEQKGWGRTNFPSLLKLGHLPFPAFVQQLSWFIGLWTQIQSYHQLSWFFGLQTADSGNICFHIIWVNSYNNSSVPKSKYISTSLCLLLILLHWRTLTKRVAKQNINQERILLCLRVLDYTFNMTQSSFPGRWDTGAEWFGVKNIILASFRLSIYTFCSDPAPLPMTVVFNKTFSHLFCPK